MGPPPVPPHALKSAQESGRPLPPHLTQYPPSRRESRFTRDEPPTPGSLKAPSLPSQSPVSGHALLSAVSPVIGTLAGLPLPLGTDLEEARKDVMHSAAARAKQRREQEEAEREAQKERARRKAQELEEKMRASELEKEKEQEKQNQKKANDIVDSIINDAVKSAQPVESQRAKPEAHASKPSRPPGDPFPGKRPPTFPSKPSAEPPKGDSWRSNIPSVPVPPLQQRKSSSGFVASSTVALDAAVDTKKEDLEIVDFSDMGKLVDGPRSNEASEKSAHSRPPRPVASDFFDDKKPSPDRETSEPTSWRRKAPDVQEQTTPVSDKRESSTPKERQTPPTKDHSSSPNAPNFVEQSIPSGATATKDSSTSQDGRHIANLPHPSSGPPRTPRSQTFYKEYKEATMSSLDDTMSRIKGAIVHMKSHEVPSSDTQPEQVQTKAPPVQSSLKAPLREKWVPPARRPRSVGFAEDEEREVFDVTVIKRPSSPPPDVLNVRLPKQSRPVEFIHRKQLQLFHKPPFAPRFDILTFDPPVEGMSRRDFSLNNVLFRRPQIVKGRIKYHVSLPRSRASKGILRGFGKPAAADSAASWRKPAASSTTNPIQALPDSSENTGLSTMSRSPPPELSTTETNIASIPKPNESVASRVESHPAVRSRPQPKMPAGSAVAMMRDSKIDVIEANVKTSVNFIVSDELEEVREPAQTVEDLPAEAPTTISPPNDLSPPTQNLQPVTKPVSAPQATGDKAPLHESSLLGSQPEIKSSDNANKTERSPFKSSNHQALPWSRSSLNVPPLRESTSRGPDPEHLKALWSQPEPSDEAGIHHVNSLEGIADDLTSLPFTLHEVKSEDGSTPPPQAAAPPPPSRMSLHDVTRAFQQVPQSASSTSAPSRHTISPPSTNSPVARPTYQYNTLPPNGMRPPYGSYPSPVTSHSPAPGMGMMYPHPPPPMASASPIPSRMQANPIYPPPQSMWVPVMGPSPPNANGMIRPVPYATPAQMMPYSPSALPTNNIYPQHVGAPPTQPSSNSVQGNRNRNMPGMSPALSHPPMYPTSPMMMHAHAHAHTPAMQSHGYAPLPAGRGQPRQDHAHLGPQQHPTPSQQQSHVIYPGATPTAPYPRSGW
ncbi:hypothetical protein EST38_g5238 [Candolleomyces aberdarensis]|uniref:Uncharacterized protein n=1 Tax=Candolleomyces aberdarensis TaxID=2316362 RepID=A0A4Q2DMS3_9AGAR|nr:hypothetical protein EST38_g5238 [Candolleomyces aberdarensis]